MWKEEWVNGNSGPHTTAIISEGNNIPESKHTQFYSVTLRHALRKGGVTSKEKLPHSEYSEKNNNKMSYRNLSTRLIGTLVSCEPAPEDRA